MKNFHPFSFGLGIASGLVIFFLVLGGMQLFGGPSAETTNNRSSGQYQGGNMRGGTSRMAERLGISEDDLQRELDSGKTFQDIARERGIELPARMQFGTGGLQRGSGTLAPWGNSRTFSSVSNGRAASSSSIQP